VPPVVVDAAALPAGADVLPGLVAAPAPLLLTGADDPLVVLGAAELPLLEVEHAEPTSPNVTATAAAPRRRFMSLSFGNAAPPNRVVRDSG
jgi:hypothetical protein